MASPPFIGRYINLDRSPGRRAALEADLERFGAADRYRRFRGVDGAMTTGHATALSKGQLGCYLSHRDVLQLHAGGGQHLHVVEDDVVFGPRTMAILDQVIDQATASYDIVYTDVSPILNVLLGLTISRGYRDAGMVEATDQNPRQGPTSVMYIPLRGSLFMSTTSYVVSSRAIGRLADVLEREGPRRPLDWLFHDMIQAGEFSACVTAPFLTSVQPPDQADSTVDAAARPMDLAAYLLRAPYFMDRDDAVISERLARLGVKDPSARGPEAVGEVLRHLFSASFSLPRV